MTVFWPFLLLNWRVKTLEISASFERAQGSQRRAVQQKKMKELTGIGSVL